MYICIYFESNRTKQSNMVSIPYNSKKQNCQFQTKTKPWPVLKRNKRRYINLEHIVENIKRKIELHKKNRRKNKRGALSGKENLEFHMLFVLCH